MPHWYGRRRAAALWLFGGGYSTYGVNALVDPQLLPGPWWLPGVLTLATGLYTLNAAIFDGVKREWLAFTALVVVAVAMSLGHVGAWLLGTGHVHPWSDMLLWLVIAATGALVGGWSEPPARLLEMALALEVRKDQQ